MSRIRTIKPEFFRHDGLGQLTRDHRLLFIGLWTLADKEGRLNDRPNWIRIELFPYDAELTEEAVDSWLWDLNEHGERFIIRYEVGGCRYISIPTFQEHQRPHPKDPASRIPSPDSPESGVREFPGISGEFPGKQIKDRVASGKAPDASNIQRVQESKSPRVQRSKNSEGDSEVPRARATKRKPSDFVLTDERFQSAVSEGLNLVDVPRQFAKFADHEFRVAKSDWEAAWRNWCREAVERRGGRVQRQLTAGEVSMENARQLLAEAEAEEARERAHAAK